MEYTILVVLALGLAIRATKAAVGTLPYPGWAAPASHALAGWMPANEGLVSLLASRQGRGLHGLGDRHLLHLTMGAWHRFTAFPNIFSSGSALPGHRPHRAGVGRPCAR